MKSLVYGRRVGISSRLRNLACATALSGLFFIHIPLCAAGIAEHAGNSGIVHVDVPSGTPVNMKTEADVVVTFTPSLNAKKQSKLTVTTSGSVNVRNLPPNTSINIHAHGAVTVTYAAGPYSGKSGGIYIVPTPNPDASGGINIVCGGDTKIFNAPQRIPVYIHNGGNVNFNYKSAAASSSRP